MEEISFDNWQKKSADHRKSYQRLLQKGNRNDILRLLPDLHDAAFEKVSCLMDSLKEHEVKYIISTTIYLDPLKSDYALNKLLKKAAHY